jgi:hypothetical protein
MSEKTTEVRVAGIGFFGLLFIVFFVLKVTGHITWSWWWITAPLWGPWVFFVGVFALIFVIVIPIMMLVKGTKK